MVPEKYQMSFTTGGLFYNESLQVAEIYKKTGDWIKTRNLVLSENILQARTESSARREAREICSRLVLMTKDQLQLLSSGSRQEQQYLLWVAVCKRYAFVKDFTVEVIREKFLRMDLHLQQEDYQFFFTKKAEWHKELEKLKNSTKNKLRQVLFRIMREAEIISRDSMIIPCLLTDDLTRVLATDTPLWLSIFPISDADIQSWLP
jgi:hypothetical protein